MNEKFMNGLLAFAGKMQSNKVLGSVRDSFIDNMPVVIMGAFTTLFQFVLSATKAQGYQISPGFRLARKSLGYVGLHELWLYELHGSRNRLHGCSALW